MMTDIQKFINGRSLNVIDGEGYQNISYNLTSSSPIPVYPFIDVSTPKPIPNHKRASSIDPYQTSIILISNVVRNKFTFTRELEAKIDSKASSCSTFSSFLAVYGCPDHKSEYKVFYKTCGLPICPCPECQRKRYGRTYGRLKSLTSGFVHNSNSPYRTKDNPLFLTLTFRSHKPLSKSERRRQLKCIKEFREFFGLKGGMIFDNKLKKDGLYHQHAHMFCDNDFTEQDIFRSKWFEITEKEFGVGSFEVKCNRVSMSWCLNYLSHRVGYPLIELYDNSKPTLESERLAKERHNKRVIHQYVKELRDQNLFIIFGFNQTERRKIRKNKFKRKDLCCKICNKPYVLRGVCFRTELNFYTEPAEKQPVIEFVPSVSSLDNLR